LFTDGSASWQGIDAARLPPEAPYGISRGGSPQAIE
jgi:hypothetical protein